MQYFGRVLFEFDYSKAVLVRADIHVAAKTLKLFAKASEANKLLLLPEGHSSFGNGKQFVIAVKDFLQEKSACEIFVE